MGEPRSSKKQKSSKNDNDKKNKKTNDTKVPNSKKAKGPCRALREPGVTQEWSDTSVQIYQKRKTMGRNGFI